MMRLLAMLVVVPCAVVGCLKGPGFLQQSGSPLAAAQDVLVVPTREELGAAVGNVRASEARTQVVQASANSAIAGSSATFPPGAVAIDTEVTLAEGAVVATDEALSSLQIATTIAAAAPSVTVASSVAMDASQPFTVAIAVPNASALALDDPFRKLVVFYRIEKAAENASYAGVLPRSSLDVQGNYVRFQTKHFGTFQAVITNDLVETAVEAPTDAKPAVKKPEPKPAPAAVARLYFQNGMALTTTGDQTPKHGNFQLWGLTTSPARVGTSTTLTTHYVAKPKPPEADP